MKKIFICLFSFAILLGLSACGLKKETPSDELFIEKCRQIGFEGDPYFESDTVYFYDQETEAEAGLIKVGSFEQAAAAMENVESNLEYELEDAKVTGKVSVGNYRLKEWTTDAHYIVLVINEDSFIFFYTPASKKEAVKTAIKEMGL